MLVLALSTSFLVWRGFRELVKLLTKQRNWIDISQFGDLRLLRIYMKANVKGLSTIITLKYTILIMQKLS